MILSQPGETRKSDDIRLFAEILLVPDAAVEVRALGVPGRDGGAWAGWFDDLPAMVGAIEQMDRQGAKGVYVTLNPVNRHLLARCKNRVSRADKDLMLSSDADVLRRLWLPIDFDPDRPSGISATEAEHRLALGRAEQVAAWLAEQGWPEPIRADSGNGGHLLYRIELPNDEEARDLVQRCLEAIALRFGGDGVTVDTGVANAARIWKAYGTMARKGENVPERPHRRSHLIALPDQLVPVDRNLLEALAAQAPQPERPASAPASSVFDVDAFLARHGLGVLRKAPWQGGWKWSLDRCPFSGAHTDGAFVVQFPNGAIAAGCHHRSCTWGWRDLRAKFQPDMKDERRHRNRTAELQVIGPVMVRLSAVQARPVEWVWPGRIARGELTLMVGDPGEGKGLVSVDIGARLTRGEALPGHEGESTEPCTVVVLSGEDHPNTVLRPRYEAAGADLDRVVLVPGKLVWQDPEANLVDLDDLSGNEPHEVPIYLTNLKPLRQVLQETKPRLLIVDPLQQYLGPEVDARRANQTRPVLEGLARLAREFNVAVLVLYHLNKDASQTKAIYRALDSIDIPAASRLVLLVGHDPDDEAKRAVLTVKSNLGRKPEGLGFEIETTAEGVPFVRWTGSTELTEDRLLGARTGQRGRPAKLDEAQAWLLDLLRPLGEEGLAVAEIVELGKDAGFSQRTLERAKKKAGVISRRLRSEEGEGWAWAAWTHCWRCQSRLDIETHERCPKCRWLRCECGACQKECPGTPPSGSSKAAKPLVHTAKIPGILAALPQTRSGQGFGTPPGAANFGGLGEAGASPQAPTQGSDNDAAPKAAKIRGHLAGSETPSQHHLSQHRQNSRDIGADTGGSGGPHDGGTVEAAFGDLNEVRL